MQVDWLQPDLRLDEALGVQGCHPLFLPPATRAPVMTSVGGDESSEFRRQNALLGARWRGALAGDIAMPGCPPFSVVDGLGGAVEPPVRRRAPPDEAGPVKQFLSNLRATSTARIPRSWRSPARHVREGDDR